jgi:hypothetical protein
MGVAMRGDDQVCGRLFSYLDLEKRVRADHPLRLIREIANAALAALTGTFEPLYSPLGRSSIPPERPTTHLGNFQTALLRRITPPPTTRPGRGATASATFTASGARTTPRLDHRRRCSALS